MDTLDKKYGDTYISHEILTAIAAEGKGLPGLLQEVPFPESEERKKMIETEAKIKTLKEETLHRKIEKEVALSVYAKPEIIVEVYDGCGNGSQGLLYDDKVGAAANKLAQEILQSEKPMEVLNGPAAKELAQAIAESETSTYPLEYGIILQTHMSFCDGRFINLGVIDDNGSIDPDGTITAYDNENEYDTYKSYLSDKNFEILIDFAENYGREGLYVHINGTPDTSIGFPPGSEEQIIDFVISKELWCKSGGEFEEKIAWALQQIGMKEFGIEDPQLEDEEPDTGDIEQG